MTDIYCANLNCKNNDGVLFEENGIYYGWCRKSEIKTDSEGKCKNIKKKG